MHYPSGPEIPNFEVWQAALSAFVHEHAALEHNHDGSMTGVAQAKMPDLVQALASLGDLNEEQRQRLMAHVGLQANQPGASEERRQALNPLNLEWWIRPNTRFIPVVYGEIASNTLMQAPLEYLSDVQAHAPAPLQVLAAQPEAALRAFEERASALIARHIHYQSEPPASLAERQHREAVMAEINLPKLVIRDGRRTAQRTAGPTTDLRPEAQAIVDEYQALAPHLDITADLSVQLTGSRSQGLATETSDYDHFMIAAPLSELGVPLSPLPEQLHAEDRSQRLYRVDKYAQMLLGGNADVVATAWITPEYHGHGRGARLITDLQLALRPHLITQQYVASCAAHFATLCSDLDKRRHIREGAQDNPAERARIEKMGSRARLDDKMIMHGLRMGYHALHTERTGERLERYPDDLRETLMALKRHELPWPETVRLVEELRGALLYHQPKAEKPWQYDARRAAHLGRGEPMRAVVLDLFRQALRVRG